MRTLIGGSSSRSVPRSLQYVAPYPGRWPVPLICFRAHAGTPEIPTSGEVRPRSGSRGPAWSRLRGPGERGTVRGGGQAAAPRAFPQQSALGRGESETVRLFARAAGPEGPQRLPTLRSSPSRRRALVSASMRPLSLLICLFVLGLTVAGCGGGTNNSAETIPAPPAL